MICKIDFFLFFLENEYVTKIQSLFVFVFVFVGLFLSFFPFNLGVDFLFLFVFRKKSPPLLSWQLRHSACKV